MAEQITIDAAKLEELSRRWAEREADAQDRMGSFTWEGGNRGNLGVTWVTKLGADGYEPGRLLSDKIEGVRAGLAARIGAFGDHSYGLRHGLNAVLADSEETEEFNTMTGDEFNASFPSSGG